MEFTNKIFNEDCCSLMNKMKENDFKVDLVITSPPYNKNAYAQASGTDKSWSAMRGRQIAYDVYNDAMPREEYEKWQREVISSCLDVLKPGGSLFYNHKDIMYHGTIIHPTWVYDFNVHEVIVWDRGSSVANDPHYFQPITEYIYWIVKDPKNINFDKSESCFRNNVWRMNYDKNPHPAPFPEILAGNLIKCCSKEGDIIYDPFMGSGTTAKMAVNLGRNYVGSEISPKYIEMAEKRIELERNTLSLF